MSHCRAKSRSRNCVKSAQSVVNCLCLGASWTFICMVLIVMCTLFSAHSVTWHLWPSMAFICMRAHVICQKDLGVNVVISLLSYASNSNFMYIHIWQRSFSVKYVVSQSVQGRHFRLTHCYIWITPGGSASSVIESLLPHCL